jgi:magnesium chelatase accessory protein
MPIKRRDRPDWSLHGGDWPHRTSSRFVKVSGLTWHVQSMGQGPVLLLAHGTGASSHSWRDLMPGLAQYFTVIAPDLQGHGLTGALPGSGMGLNEMAAGLGSLVAALGVSPVVAVGHSAGAAILSRLVLDGTIAPDVLVSLNGALLPLPLMTGLFFRAAARLLALSPVVSRWVSWRARRPGMVEKIIAKTGSKLSVSGLDYYTRLMRSPHHVRNVLHMLSNWDLRQFVRDLPCLPCRLVLVSADGDLALPPQLAHRTAALVRGCELIVHKSYGHLSHEEAPEETTFFILRAARASGIALGREALPEQILNAAE